MAKYVKIRKGTNAPLFENGKIYRIRGVKKFNHYISGIGILLEDDSNNKVYIDAGLLKFQRIIGDQDKLNFTV